MNRGPSSPSSDRRGRNLGVPRTPPLDWAQASGAADLVEREMNACVERRRRRHAMTKGAFAVMLLLTAGAVWQTRQLAPATLESRAIVSMPTRQILPDGSVVELKDDAQIVVDYSTLQRRVTLARGEAHFEVVKEAVRPFVVEANGVAVRAVGTAFAVQLGDKTVEVIVTEGRVAVEQGTRGQRPKDQETRDQRRETRDEGPRDQGTKGPKDLRAARVPQSLPPSLRHSLSPLYLAAGHRVSIDTVPQSAVEPTVQTVTDSELARRLAWRVPRIEFNFTPLSEVIPTFNQYGSARLRLADPELGTLKLSGVLRADNVPVLLQILESSYGVKAERTSAEIVLYRTR